MTASKEFNVSWEQTYSYPIRLTVYPRYKEYTGEIWDKDIQFDDKVGTYEVLEAIGDDIRVYRQY